MSDPVALVTGAAGEVGHLLIPRLRSCGMSVLALDLAPLPDEIASQCLRTYEASIMDQRLLDEIFERYPPTSIFHLAAVLSAKAEVDPALAHSVNVEGTLGLFRRCQQQAARNSPVRFLFPSSIAVYGFPDAASKAAAGAVREVDWNVPRGIYGCNKLYCELIGSFLSLRGGSPALDFRSIRFPGLLSADTLPTSGTTDYAPAMVHAAVQGKPYSCFVEPEARLPFMTMPDAVEALVQLASAAPEKLGTRVYNIRGFSASAEEIRGEILRHYPAARLDFEAIAAKQQLVDSWPADVDDTRARREWGLAPRHGLREAIDDYLIPALRRRYGSSKDRDIPV